MTLREQLLTLADAYSVIRGLSRSRISTLVFNGGHVIDGIASGKDLTTRSFEKAVLWFSANWPDDRPWPKEVLRPARNGRADTAA